MSAAFAIYPLVSLGKFAAAAAVGGPQELISTNTISSLESITDAELRRDIAAIFCNQSCDEGFQPFRWGFI
jgi:hypothetical protein